MISGFIFYVYLRGVREWRRVVPVLRVTAVHSGYDPLSSYLQHVWWKRNPPKEGTSLLRRDLRIADAERKGSDRFAEWVADCGGSEAAAMVLSGGGEPGEFRSATRDTLRRRLQELDALGTSNERVGEGGEGPAVLDAFLDANCGDDDTLDYDELVAKHSHPLDPAEAPLPPHASGLVAPPRSPHALGAVPPGERSRLAMIRPATSGGETGPRPATGAANLGESGSIGNFYAAMGAGAVEARAVSFTVHVHTTICI